MLIFFHILQIVLFTHINHVSLEILECAMDKDCSKEKFEFVLSPLEFLSNKVTLFASFPSTSGLSTL